MKILLVTQYFYPENFKSNDIAFELVKRGYKVDVLTGIPNYPEGKYYKGYGIFNKRIEKVEGVNVFRAFQAPRGTKKSPFLLFLNYITFSFCSSLDIIYFFFFKKKYDRIFIFQTSPIYQAIPGVLLGIFKNIPVYTWVQDFWPGVAYYNVKNKIIINITETICHFVYKRSEKILISSEGFKKLIEDFDGSHDNIIYFPNWYEDVKRMDKIEVETGDDNGYKIMMAGNLGTVQVFDALFDLIIELKNTKIKWLFVGSGSMIEELSQFVKLNGLADSVKLFGKQPFEYMPSFYEYADAMLLTLKTDKTHLKVTIPSRLQSYMSSGKPILAMAGEGCKDIINNVDCGFAVEPEDMMVMRDYIKKEVLCNPEKFALKGKSGRAYFLENYLKSKCISNLEKLLI